MYRSPSGYSAKSSTTTPKSRHHAIDEHKSAPRSRLQNSRFLEKPVQIAENATKSLLEKEKRLDDQFKNLLDRCNKSRDYIENIHKANFLNKSKESLAFLSPKANTIPRSPLFSRESAAHRAIRELESPQYDSKYGSSEKYQAPIRERDPVQTLTHQQAVKENSDDYLQLENDIISLKKTILDKLKSDEKASRKDLKFKDLSDDDEIDDYLADQKTTSRLHSASKKDVQRHPHKTSSKVLLN